MANSLFNIFGNSGERTVPDIFGEIENFKKKFNIDPQREVINLLNSGQMSQAQFNQLAQEANRIMSSRR